MTVLVVNSEIKVSEASSVIRSLFDKYKYIRIKVERESRTLKQNAWTHQAYRMIAEQKEGTTHRYWRNFCKYTFGLAIRAEKEPEFAELLKPMLLSLTYEERLDAMDYIDVTSTFDVKQMTDFINEIIVYFQGLQLPEEQF